MFVIHVHSEINKRETFFFLKDLMLTLLLKGEIYIFDVMQTIRRLEVVNASEYMYYTPHTLSYNTVRSNIKFFRYLTAKA